MEGLSVLDMIQTGWVATYPLILFSMVTLSIVLERAWSLRSLVSQSLSLAHTICPSLERGDFDSALADDAEHRSQLPPDGSSPTSSPGISPTRWSTCPT